MMIDTATLDIGETETTFWRVKYGRAVKKVEKLKKQRDHYKEQYEKYKHMVTLHPSFRYRYEDYEKGKADRTKMKELERRCNEQEQLILLLNKGDKK